MSGLPTTHSEPSKEALQFLFAKECLEEVLVFHRGLVVLAITFAPSALIAQSAKPPIAVPPCSSGTPHLSSEELMRLVATRKVITPPMMERLSLHGKVTLRVCVSKKGRVLSAAVVGGQPMAYQAVLDSVQKWTFKSYRVDGRARDVTGDLEVDYDFASPPPLNTAPH
jgi:outer membrane biosynthesis protein TonB